MAKDLEFAMASRASEELQAIPGKSGLSFSHPIALASLDASATDNLTTS
jgi:hypothetical protein